MPKKKGGSGAAQTKAQAKAAKKAKAAQKVERKEQKKASQKKEAESDEEELEAILEKVRDWSSLERDVSPDMRHSRCEEIGKTRTKSQKNLSKARPAVEQTLR